MAKSKGQFYIVEGVLGQWQTNNSNTSAKRLTYYDLLYNPKTDCLCHYI